MRGGVAAVRRLWPWTSGLPISRFGLAARPRARWAEQRMSSSSCSSLRILASSSLFLRSSFS